jgi:hypothetical protein
MDKSEWAKILQHPGEFERAVESFRALGLSAFDLLTDTDRREHTALEQPSHTEPLTRELTTANNRSVAGLPAFDQLEGFVPELSGQNPLETLQGLEARFRADPSTQNGLLLQSAMNHLTRYRTISEEHRRAVERAATLFGAEDLEHVPARTDDIYYKAYEDRFFEGRSVFEDMTPGFAYWRRPDFSAAGFPYGVGSIAFGAAVQETGGRVILFDLPHYSGRYKNYQVIPGQIGGGDQDVAGNPILPGSFGGAQSALIIRRFPKETRPILMSNYLPASTFTDMIADVPMLRMNGAVSFSWDMWPYFDIERTFMTVTVPLMFVGPRIGLLSAPDQRVIIWYWIYPYVNSQGLIQAYAAWSGYYIQGGPLTGQIEDRLKPEVARGARILNGTIARVLDQANVGAPYQFLYLLPGKNQLSGNVSDDVTIVAVRR